MSNLTDTRQEAVSDNRSRMLVFIISVSLLLLASQLIFSEQLFAAQFPGAESDLNEDIIYSSDGGGSIETIGNVRVTTLRGNVRVRQGLTEIFGDTARLEQDPETGELIRVTVEGSPARFIRETEDSAQSITGSSAAIIYYNHTPEGQSVPLSVVEFVGEASFNRGRTALLCSQIKHIVETGATDSPGPCSGVLAPGTD